MNQDWLVLLVCLAVSSPWPLLYAAGRGYHSALTSIGEFRSSLEQIRLETKNIHHAIQLQKPVLYDAHKRIYAVTKSLENRPR